MQDEEEAKGGMVRMLVAHWREVQERTCEEEERRRTHRERGEQLKAQGWGRKQGAWEEGRGAGKKSEAGEGEEYRELSRVRGMWADRRWS